MGDRIHKCEEGHQIQAFGGNRHKANNYSVTFSCDQLEDEDMIFWKDEDLKWGVFKGKIFQGDNSWVMDN